MQDETDVKPAQRAVRPRDAATLILVRRGLGGADVLMGQRHAGHKFMPNKFVFPGGRVDAADLRVKVPIGLRPDVETRAAHGTTRERARAFALAAIRETFEETGLRVARPAESPMRTKAGAWSAFSSAGCVPALDALDFVFRAITPPQRHRRFDTRFFLADAEAIFGETAMSGSGELLALHWVPLADADKLDLPNITRVVLKEVARRIESPQEATAKTPFTRFVRGKPRMDFI